MEQVSLHFNWRAVIYCGHEEEQQNSPMKDIKILLGEFNAHIRHDNAGKKSHVATLVGLHERERRSVYLFLRLQ